MPPKQFVRGEWFVSIALLTGVVWVLCAWAGLSTWWSVGIAFVIGFSAGSASAALSALGSGMLAFTGFVTSIVLLIIQFGTSEFSPRFLGWFRTDPTLKYSLSTFIATFLFALVSTAQMGPRRSRVRAGTDAHRRIAPDVAKHRHVLVADRSHLLSVGVATDGTGVMRLVYPTPTWEDLVELTLDEIRAFGAGQYQVARRLRALLDALIADLPEHRRPALEAQSALPSDAVEHSFRQTQRADALFPDRQGIGMSHRERANGH